MKRALVVLVPLASLLWGCARRDPAAPPPPEVAVAKVFQTDVPVVHEWVGTLDGTVNADIRPQVTGYVSRQAYHDGQYVPRGALLFEIDPRQFRAALEQAQGALGRAQAQLAKATLDVERFTPLAAEKAVSQQELDDAVAAKRDAQAAVAAAQAAVDQAALNLTWTRVTALISGVAGIAKAQVGDLVGPQSVMTTVSTLDPIRATFGISEQEYLQLAGAIAKAERGAADQGPDLLLVLQDGTVYPHRGHIILADRQVDPRTGTLTVDGSFPNPGNLLRPGQYARVRAATQVKAGALLVPQRAVMELQGGHQIAVVGPDSKVDVRSVELGERVGPEWVVTRGLRPGETVAVSGLQFIRAGMSVRTKPFEEPSAAGTASASTAR